MSETSERLLEACMSLVAEAYNEGFRDGHDQGLSCGHDLSPKCKYPSELFDSWHGSAAKRAFERLKEETL